MQAWAWSPTPVPPHGGAFPQDVRERAATRRFIAELLDDPRHLPARKLLCQPEQAVGKWEV